MSRTAQLHASCFLHGVLGLVSLAAGCADRPLPLPETSNADLSPRGDLASADLAVRFDLASADLQLSDDLSVDLSVVDARDADAVQIDGAMVDAAPNGCTASGVTRLTTTAVAPDQMILDASYIYYHDQTGLWRVAKSGGTATLLATVQTFGSRAFAVDDSGVTWWQVRPGQMSTDVIRVPKQGGAQHALATLPDYFFNGVAGGTGAVYLWAQGASKFELDYIAPDGTVTASLNDWPNTFPLVFDGTTLFGALRGGGVYRVVGSSLQYLGSSPFFFVDDMVVDDSAVYSLSTGDAVGNVTGAAVSSVPKSGGTATTLMTTTVTQLGPMAIDATDIYLPDRQDGAIFRISKDGTSQTTMIMVGAPPPGILAVAVDDRCLYWTTGWGSDPQLNAIFAAPK
jgi:hypothetical protein